jgi:hypothetical protein
MSFDAPGPVPDPVAAPEPAAAPDPAAAPLIGKDVLAPMPPSRRGSRRWLVIAGAGVLAIALVVGLIVWHPWNPPPGAPAALHGTSPTATSVQLTWPASTGGNVGHYLVLRDGRQVGEIPAGEVSWTDHGLVPGVTHSYTVKAQGSGGTSGPSVAATVTTLTPSPVGLKVVKTNWVSATLAWRPSPLGPVPSDYVIYDGTNVIDTIPGTADTYTDATLTPGGSFSYSVVAQWGSHASRPSSAVSGSSLAPPLDGPIPVSVTATSIPSGSTGPSSGEVKSYQWSFTPTCAATGCTISTDGYLPSYSTHYTEFSTRLAGSGTSYSASVKGPFSRCGTVTTTDTLTLHVTANKGQVNNGAWAGWTGTVVLTEPYTTSGSGYCPTQSWYFSLSGKS